MEFSLVREIYVLNLEETSSAPVRCSCSWQPVNFGAAGVNGTAAYGTFRHGEGLDPKHHYFW